MDKLNIKLEGNTKVLEIRQGDAVKLQEPKKLGISGYINSVSTFLSLRVDTIEQKKCHILIERETFKIMLILDECNFYYGVVEGCLKHTKTWENFGINTGKEWTTHELADFIKMHRAYFEKPSDAANLVTELRNFRLNVDQQLENTDNKRGNINQVRRQIVETNIPASFNVVLPIFKGQKAETIELEVFINADNFNCTLVSAEAQEKIHRTTDGIIDEQISIITEICPDMVIINQ